jgi:hypothetical protein
MPLIAHQLLYNLLEKCALYERSHSGAGNSIAMVSSLVLKQLPTMKVAKMAKLQCNAVIYLLKTPATKMNPFRVVTCRV